MNSRMEWQAKIGSVPFDLDFLRELGVTFRLDWDGELLVEVPEVVDRYELLKLILLFEQGIKRRLGFEQKRAMQQCMGGPMNGRHLECPLPCSPTLFHIKRGEWAVYSVRQNDPRAWFVGIATSKKSARKMWREAKNLKR